MGGEALMLTVKISITKEFKLFEKFTYFTSSTTVRHTFEISYKKIVAHYVSFLYDC